MNSTQSVPLDELVAREVRAELGRQNKSKAELARGLGRTEWWIGRRLSAEVEFTLTELQSVAEFLDVHFSQFLQGKHEEMDRRGMDRGLAPSLGGRTEALEPKVPRQQRAKPVDRPADCVHDCDEVNCANEDCFSCPCCGVPEAQQRAKQLEI